MSRNPQSIAGVIADVLATRAGNVEVAAQIVNELLFPVGCSLALYATNALVRNVARA